MQLSFQYGTKNIKFTVTYSKRKTILITVEPPDVVKVRAPLTVPKEVVLDIVKDEASWIVEKIHTFIDIEYISRKKEFINGETFLYLGRNYSLQINLNEHLKKPEVKLYQGKFLLETPTKDEMAIREAMVKWYRQKATEKIQKRKKPLPGLLGYGCFYIV